MIFIISGHFNSRLPESLLTRLGRRWSRIHCCRTRCLRQAENIFFEVFNLSETFSCCHSALGTKTDFSSQFYLLKGVEEHCYTFSRVSSIRPASFVGVLSTSSPLKLVSSLISTLALFLGTE